MSLVIEIFPQCDRCLETYPDFLMRSARQCRAFMRSGGWRRSKGLDVCPDCVLMSMLAEKPHSPVTDEPMRP